MGSAWAPACAVCVCAGAYRVAWRSRWGVGVSVVWSVDLYPPCAGDPCRIPAAAVAFRSPATKAWRGQPPLSMAHVSSMFSTQHLPTTQRAASPSPGAALLHAFAGRSRQSRPRAPLRHCTMILLPVCCPFCPTLLAVPTRRRASHCPVASSALACATVLCRPFSPLPRRSSCALRLGSSSASSITTSPSTVSSVPVLLCAPVPLCSSPPLLLSVTSPPHPPPPPPTPCVRLPASHLPVPPHAPGPLPLALPLPVPARPYASPPYRPSRCNSSRSI